MDGLDLVVREVNEQLKAYAEAHNIKGHRFLYHLVWKQIKLDKLSLPERYIPTKRGYRLMAYKALEVFTPDYNGTIIRPVTGL